MSKIAFTFISCFFVLWCIMGTPYYMRLNNMVVNKAKHLVLVLISGPLVWLYAIFMSVFSAMDYIVSDTILNKLENWFIK